VSAKQKKKRPSSTTTVPSGNEHGNEAQDGIPHHKWELRDLPTPSNRQRAMFSAAVAVFAIWLLILAWLVWDSM
jgi:hypothetical protein